MDIGSHGNRGAAKRVVTVAVRLAILTFAVSLFSHNLADVDLWGNVGFVRALPWQAGYHRANTYSYTQPDYAWTNHEWGAEYVLFRVHAACGNAGLLLLKIAIGIGLLLILHAEMRRDGVSPPVRAGLLMLVLSTMGYGFSTRPHLFTYLLSALLILLVRRGRIGTVAMLSPALGCLWANTHGAFFIGLVILAPAVLTGAPCAPRDEPSPRRARLRARLLPACACAGFAAGSLITPYGAALWDFVRHSAAIFRPFLSEWAPFHPIRDFTDHSDFLALAVVVALAGMRAGRRLVSFDGVLVAAALLAALVMRRNIPLFALCAGLCAGPWIDCAVGPALARLVARLRPAWIVAAMLAVAVISGGHVLLRRDAPWTIEIPAADFPVETVNLMAHAGIEGNMLVFFDWAEYCIWKLYPRCRVFMDGRFCSAYSASTIRDYVDFLYGAPDWRRALDDYKTDLVFVHRGNPCAALVGADPAWRLVLADEIAVLYARTETAEALAARLAEARRTWIPPPPHFP